LYRKKYIKEEKVKYPESLKKGDTIGICAPSGGIADKSEQKRLDEAIKQLREMGYKIIETNSVRKEERGRSGSAVERANELMCLLENPDVKLIIFAAGGDFLVEILDKLDWEKIKKLPPKWLQGYSNITSINFLFNTILDIPSIYSQNIKDYAMRPLHTSLTNALEIASGKEIIQKSFELYEGEFNKEQQDINPNATYNLNTKVYWQNITGEIKIEMHGRALGGCLDDIRNIFATKYDNISNYIEKYKEDGIIWFLECFDISSTQLFLTLWQMKNAGYLEYCNGIIFGRPLFKKIEYDISYNQSILDAIGDLNIPIICEADIGHVSPQLALVNGAILDITSQNGKGEIKTYFK